MAPSIMKLSPTACTLVNDQVPTKKTHITTTEALDAAKTRFTDRNPSSLKLHNESVKSMPGGNTRSLLHTAPFPVFLKHGEGYQVTSEDGHTYTDFVGEMTAGLFDLVRFTNSGTEANLHALAAAKRFTGKRKVVVFTGGYHGGCFSFPSDTPAANCVDGDDWIVAEYNDVADTRRKIEESADVAAVLVEGMQGRGPCIVGSDEFLHQIQMSARKAGAVFILDEVMTSRLSGGGLAELEGLNPDMKTMGKYLGGGITFGCFGGRKEIMRLYDPREPGTLAHSGTFNNNTLAMTAGYTAMSQIYTPDIATDFNAMGDKLHTQLHELSVGTKMTVTGRGSIIGIHFLHDGCKDIRSFRDRKDDVELKDLFWMEMMEQGYWISKRGSIALILGTPWAELERFVGVVGQFLNKHEKLVKM